MYRIEKDYTKKKLWEDYCSEIIVEYNQSFDEGLDIEVYKPLFEECQKLPNNEYREKIADVLFEIIKNAEMRKDYKYNEPSEYNGITALCEGYELNGKVNQDRIKEQIKGAWYGRIIGCLLGKCVEGWEKDKIKAHLEKTGNYPLSHYIDCGREYNGMPEDDDTNYTVIYLMIVERYGRNFTPENIVDFWLHDISRDSVCTAETAARRNFIEGYYPPYSAVYKNPYREYIGAQIRADLFGYINPGNPRAASEMAFRDACISHIKNGIYGEMFVAAMIAAAAVTEDIKEIINTGLSQIPKTSRLYEAVKRVISNIEGGMTYEEFVKDIHTRYNESYIYDWCHTISNAEIVAACLLFSCGDYEKGITLAVMAGFDTDCNGATVGSVIGMRNGCSCIDEKWLTHLGDSLETGIYHNRNLKISDTVDRIIKQANI